MKHIFSLLLVIICIGVANAQPVNDEPCDAISLTVDTTCNLTLYSATGATNTGGVPAPPCGGSGKDVWFSFTVPASGMFTIETTSGTITDGMLAVYTGPCDSLVYAYCDDDSGPGLMPLLDCHAFIPGSTVYIRFYKKGGGAGNFHLCVWDNNPPLGPNNDCLTAQQLCTEASFTANTLSNGDMDDLTGSNSGCLTPNEHQSTWYYFTFGAPGEFNFTITPLDPDDNYNFAVWGPDPVCPLTEDPIRCSASNEDGSTGINTTETDLTEGVPGDGWVKFIPVNTGETYLVLIDNYSESGEGFTFNFDGPPTITCDDYFLPVTLTQFYGYNSGPENILQWSTATEIDNAWFSVEHSDNGEQFNEIGKIPGAGSSTELHNYSFTDLQPFGGVTYYRLKQIDYNGQSDYSDLISVVNLSAAYFTVTPNPSTGIVTVNHMEAAGTVYSLEVINAWGVKTYSQDIVASGDLENNKISFSSKGIYWVILRNGDRSFSQKIIIN